MGGVIITIYSKKLRNKLLEMGFNENKEPEPNFKNPDYLVFFFPDDERIIKFVEEYNSNVGSK